MVYVISQGGKPLMPCENVTARLLLKEGKVKPLSKPQIFESRQLHANGQIQPNHTKQREISSMLRR